MHELALMESVVAAVEDEVRPARVACVRLQIGRLAGALPEALRFCFDVCARGTSLEGAALEILEVEGRARCRTCGGERTVQSFLDLCPCGSADLEVFAGRELRIHEVEVH
jgi:hydrogenase nickel incorporation protein HypA/HybF